MSYRHTDWAMTVQVENAAQRLVLMAIASYANADTGECFPSRAALKKITMYSQEFITRTCRRLESLGLLSVEPRHDDAGRQTSNAYRLPMLSPPQVAETEARKMDIEGDRGSWGGDPRSGGRVIHDQGEGDPRSGGRVTHDHPHSLTSKIEPVTEPVRLNHCVSTDVDTLPAGSKRPAPAHAAKGKVIRRNGNHHEPSPGSLVWSAYATAYLERYGTEPVRNASVNAKLAAFAKRLPANEAPSVAAWYVNSGFSVYVRSKHCVDLMLRDAEGLRTEWATGARMGSTEARRIDEHEASAEAVRWVSANAEALGLDPAWLNGKV